MLVSPFLIALLPVILGVMSWTGQLGSLLSRIEQRQVALDNAAIAAAREQRALFNFLGQLNRKLRVLEVAHHGVHLCPTLACRSADKSIEALLLTIHRLGHGRILSQWTMSHRAIRAQLDRVGLTGARTTVPLRAPIEGERCSVCGFHRRWRLPAPTPFYVLEHVSELPVLRVSYRLNPANEEKYAYQLSP